MTNQTPKFIMPLHRALCWTFLCGTLACSGHETVERGTPLDTKMPAPPAPLNPLPPAMTSYPLQDAHDAEHLQKANQAVQSGDTLNAQKQLDLVNQASLSVEQRSLFHLLEAQISLSSGAAEQALTQMENIRPRLLEGDDKIHFYQSLAFAQALTGNTLGSVSARVRLGNLLKNPQQQQENVAAIVDGLSNLPLEQTQSVPLELREELDGWIALAKILQQRNQAGFNSTESLQQWQQAYAGHPANAEFLQHFLSSVPAAVVPPNADKASVEPTISGPMIAVLLPASGNFASAAQAIKLGLKTAAKAASGSLPLKFYDTEQGDITALYQQAVNEGAKHVIGPLVKEHIQALSAATELKIPVLALNHVENLSKPNLYQFGLSPIDEAEQLALKAHKDGRKNAIVLVPNSSQGHRIEQLLTSAWYAQGGMMTGSQSYDPKQHEVGNLLNGLLVPADAGGKKPSQTVFISASPEVARELAPVLKYHQNGDLAIYAMPNVYTGRPDPVHDAELGNIHFCDMPWVLGNSYSGPLSQAALQSTWQSLSDSQIKLFALGLDAYTIINQLDQLTTTAYNGATGRLTLNSGDNRISRHLVCAEFRAGAPIASGYVD